MSRHAFVWKKRPITLKVEYITVTSLRDPAITIITTITTFRGIHISQQQLRRVFIQQTKMSTLQKYSNNNTNNLFHQNNGSSVNRKSVGQRKQ